MKIDCPVITVDRKDDLWLIYDDTTPIVGRGLSCKTAFECYFRGLDLLQQKYADIDIDFNAYLDYLERKKVGYLTI